MRATLLLATLAVLAITACRTHTDPACGPKAVSNAMKRLDVHVTPAAARARIVRPGIGQVFRDVLSVLNPRAQEITWPPELVDALRHFGAAEVRVHKGDHAELVSVARRIVAEGGTGIILMRDPTSISAHYMAFPPVDPCEAFYRGRAVFFRVYHVLPSRKS